MHWFFFLEKKKENQTKASDQFKRQSSWIVVIIVIIKDQMKRSETKRKSHLIVNYWMDLSIHWICLNVLIRISEWCSTGLETAASTTTTTRKTKINSWDRDRNVGCPWWWSFLIFRSILFSFRSASFTIQYVETWEQCARTMKTLFVTIFIPLIKI